MLDLSHISGSNNPGIRFISRLLKIALIAAVLFPNISAKPRCKKPEFDESVWEEVGKSVKGRPIKIAKLGEGSITIFLLGVIHGNEPAGKKLLECLLGSLMQKPKKYSGKRLLIMPVANPDGLARNRRVNANGVDLNRNFPTKDWTPKRRRRKYTPGPFMGSEPETKVLVKIIEEEKPDLIVSVHQPLRCINYDGPAEKIARKLVRSFRLPLKRDIGYNTPGSLGTYSGVERGIPTITIELPKTVGPKRLGKRYLPGLIKLIRSI